MSDLTTTLATPQTLAPLPEEFEALLDTPFEEWYFKPGSFAPFNQCGCCGQWGTCIND